MRRCWVRKIWVRIMLPGAAVMMCAASAVVAGGAGTGVAAAVSVAPAGAWHKAIDVPGLGALNRGGYAAVMSVSCASAGNCAAGGFYRDRSRHMQGFVVSQRKGRWGRAVEVPGLGALNRGGTAIVYSVSCGSAGNCAAGGSYQTRSGRGQGFVVSQRKGRWGKAVEVRRLGALNRGGNAGVYSVSCGSAGNCAAGGSYQTRSGRGQGFVASQKRGRWGRAVEVRRLGALNRGGNAGVNSVSCASAGNCAAGGIYQTRSGRFEAFVVSQRKGRWGRAIEVPGLGALNRGMIAAVTSVSCGSAGNCAAGGSYDVRSGNSQGFVVSQRKGRWGRAAEVPGPGALNRRGYAIVYSVSCASAGHCAAGGSYLARSGGIQGFVVSRT